MEIQVDGQRSGLVASRMDALAGTDVLLRYDLPRKVIHETTDGMDYELHWRGDEIVGILPHDDFYAFYPAAEGSAMHTWPQVLTEQSTTHAKHSVR